MSARKGRKLTAAASREPNGRLSRRIADQIGGIAPAAIMRLRDKAIRAASDPAWGTPIGRMFLEERLTASQYEAGKRWDGLARLYQTAIQAPAPNPKSPSPEGSIGGERHDVDTEVGEKEAKHQANIVRDFESARSVLVDCGAFVLTDVRRICEGNGESPRGFEAERRLVAGLSALARHWDLTTADRNRQK